MITETVKEDMVKAMKARDALKRESLRSLMSAFTNELVAQKRKPTEELSDEDAIAVVKRAVKQREESAEQYENAGRTELAEKERAEKDVLVAYLPAELPREDIEKVARAKQAELGVTDKREMGRLMGAVMQELKGKADGSLVKEVVESLLA